MSSAAEGREAISEPFTGTAPQRGKRNEDSFITKQHVVTCDQGCSASLSRAAVVAVFLFFHVAGRVSSWYSRLLHICTPQGSGVQLGTARTFCYMQNIWECVTAVLPCKGCCLMPSWNFSWLWCMVYFNSMWSGNVAGYSFRAGTSVLWWSKSLGLPAQLAFLSVICKHWGANICFSNSLIKTMNNQQATLLHYLQNIQEECLCLF